MYRLGNFYDSCPRLFDRKTKRVVISFSIGKLNKSQRIGVKT
jgi:hypothetical protein